MTADYTCFIIEDHPVVRSGVQDLCREFPGVQNCVEFAEARSALDASTNMQPDLVVSDVVMPGLSIFAAIRQMKARYPELKSILFTAMVTPEVVEEGTRSGATGLVSKNVMPADFLEAVETVMAGGTYLCPAFAAVSEVATDFSAKLAILTVREREILGYLCTGLGMVEISKVLNISYKTVDSHRGAIYRKLGVTSHRSLLTLAHNLKLESSLNVHASAHSSKSLY